MLYANCYVVYTAYYVHQTRLTPDYIQYTTHYILYTMHSMICVALHILIHIYDAQSLALGSLGIQCIVELGLNPGKSELIKALITVY